MNPTNPTTPTTPTTHTSLIPSEPAAFRMLLPARKRRAVDVEVLASRIGRIAFGVGFLVGPALIGLFHVAGLVEVEHLAPFLLTGWFGALLARIVVPAVASSWLAEGTGRTGDELLSASLIVPGVLLAIVGPISLHAPISFAVGGHEALDNWAAMSFIVVGLAHLVLAVLVVKRAWRLVDGDEAMSPKSIYWFVVAVAGVPGVIAFGLPPIITGITGLAALPLLHRMQIIVDEERRRLAQTPA